MKDTNVENNRVILDKMMAMGLSHDMKNGLAPVVLVLGVLRELTSDSEMHALLNKADIAAERLKRQIQQFDGWIKSEPPRGGCDTTKLINRILEDLDVQRPANVSLVRKIGGSLLPTTMESTAIEGVLVNLVDNAYAALALHGGTVEVIAHNVLLDRAIPGVMGTVIPAGSWVAVSVIDNGPGIPFEVEKRLFEPYNTSKPPGKGTGLGLATIKHILVSNGGGIRYRSIPGSTCFRFYLPVLPGEVIKAEV